MALVNQADYAAQHGVSRKTVTKWKAAGYLVFSNGMVDAEASDAVLRERRLGRFGDVTQQAEGNEPGNSGAAAPAAVAPAPTNGEPDVDDLVQTGEAFIRDVLAGRYASFAEAERIKENALALKHVLDGQKEAGRLVEISVAERILFETSRAERDAWLNWPTRVGPLLAADLGLEADKVTEALAAHVHKHLSELGEPAANFGDEG